MTFMTQRDKKLLLLVLCALILVVCVQYLILPALDTRNALQMQLAEVEMQQAEWEMQLKILTTIDDTIAANIQNRDEASQPYHEGLHTRQMDELITGLVLECGLFPKQLQLKSGVPAMVPDYLYFTPATERSLEPQGYVYIGTAELMVEGDMDQWEQFLDIVEKTQPGLRVVSFDVEEKAILVNVVGAEDYVVSWTNEIRAVLEIYMCVPAEEVA